MELLKLSLKYAQKKEKIDIKIKLKIKKYIQLKAINRKIHTLFQNF